MTVRFLRAWNGNAEGDIAAFSAAEESRLIGLGIATATLNAQKSGPVFDSMSEFQAAGGAAANPGPVWIGETQYFAENSNLYDSSGGLIVEQTPVGTSTIVNNQITEFKVNGINYAMSYDNGLPRITSVNDVATGKFVYVAPTGNDANSYAQAQIESTPWRTPRQVFEDASTTGAGVYVAAGTYLADGTGDYPDNYHRIAGKSLAWFFDDNAILQSTHVSNAQAYASALPSNGFLHVYNATIDGRSLNNKGFENGAVSTGNWTITYDHCTAYDFLASCCVFGTMNSGTFTAKNCNFSGDLSTAVINSSGTSVASAGNVSLTVNKNTLKNSRASGSAYGVIFDNTGAITNTFTGLIESNNITVETNSTSSAAVGASVKTPNTDVLSNVITINTPDTSTSSAFGVYQLANGAAITDVNVALNVINFNAPAGYGIGIGDDASAVASGIVEKNTVIGKYYSDKTPHGIALRAGCSGTVRYNKVKSAYAGLLASKTVATTSFTGNVTVDCYGADLYAKGCTAATFDANTCVITGANARRSLGVISVDSQGGTNTVATTMSNNVVLVGTDDLSKIGSLANITVNQTCTYSNNIYVVPDTIPDTTDLFYVGGNEGGNTGATAYNIDEWRAATSISNGTGTVTVTNERVLKLPLATIQQMIANLGV